MTVRLPSLSQLIQSETGRAKGTLTINYLREASRRRSVKAVSDFFRAHRGVNGLLQYPSVLRTKLCKDHKESTVTALCLPGDVRALLCKLEERDIDSIASIVKVSVFELLSLRG